MIHDTMNTDTGGNMARKAKDTDVESRRKVYLFTSSDEYYLGTVTDVTETIPGEFIEAIQLAVADIVAECLENEFADFTIEVR